MSIGFGLGLKLPQIVKENTVVASPILRTFDFTSGVIPAGVTGTGGNNGTVRDQSGHIVAASAPRIDYTGGVAQLLIEDAADNLIYNSRTFPASDASEGQYGWSYAGHQSNGSGNAAYKPVVTPNNQIGIDGQMSAARVDLKSATNQYELSSFQRYVAVDVGSTYCLQIDVHGIVGGEQLPVVVQGDASISYAVIVSQIFTLTTAFPDTPIYVVFTATTPFVYLSVGSDAQHGFSNPAMSIVMDNWQLFKGARPQSRIFSGATPVTRATDVITFNNPTGTTDLVFSYADGTSQWSASTAGAYSVPIDLNRRRISSISCRAVTAKAVASIVFSPPVKLNASGVHTVSGDTWNPAWAWDDNEYTPMCDVPVGGGFDGVGGNSNSAVARMGQPGDVHSFDATAGGVIVNPLTMLGDFVQTSGQDNASFKLCGFEFIRGTALLFATRDAYGRNTAGGQPDEYRQSSFAAKLLRSTDFCQTFTPATPSKGEPYVSGTFPQAFGAPMFLKYPGRDYRNNGWHRSGEYVYAYSNSDGTRSKWNNGDGALLGRCLISVVANGDPADWTYYKGGDGMLDASWGIISQAALLWSDPYKVGQFVVVYSPKLKAYIALPWYYTTLNSVNGTLTQTPRQTNDTTWKPRWSPTPWGPWTALPEQRFNTGTGLGSYQPAPSMKSMAYDDTSGNQHFNVLFTNDYWNQGGAGADYTKVTSGVTVTPA